MYVMCIRLISLNLLETEVKIRDLGLIDSKWIPPPLGWGGCLSKIREISRIWRKIREIRILGGFEQLGEATRPGILWLQNQCFRG